MTIHLYWCAPVFLQIQFLSYIVSTSSYIGRCHRSQPTRKPSTLYLLPSIKKSNVNTYKGLPLTLVGSHTITLTKVGCVWRTFPNGA